jgi:hypothetical protein
MLLSNIPTKAGSGRTFPSHVAMLHGRGSTHVHPKRSTSRRVDRGQISRDAISRLGPVSRIPRPHASQYHSPSRNSPSAPQRQVLGHLGSVLGPDATSARSRLDAGSNFEARQSVVVFADSHECIGPCHQLCALPTEIVLFSFLPGFACACDVSALHPPLSPYVAPAQFSTSPTFFLRGIKRPCFFPNSVYRACFPVLLGKCALPIQPPGTNLGRRLDITLRQPCRPPGNLCPCNGTVCKDGADLETGRRKRLFAVSPEELHE